MTTATIERQILMSAPMVRAILNTRPGSWPAEPIDPGKPFKWQTRRIIKPQPYMRGMWDEDMDGCPMFEDADGDWHRIEMNCKYGRPGDRLWVRETWSSVIPEIKNGEWVPWRPDSILFDPYNCPKLADRREIFYRASGNVGIIYGIDDEGPRWHPSIHMPRWACRLLLEVREIKVERVQDITEEDAIAEGFSSKDEFLHLFFNVNKRSEKGSNPWVWVVKFSRAASPEKRA